MKAYLSFNLPRDKCDHEVAVHAMDWALTVLDIENQLRNWSKYGNEFKDVEGAIESIRDKIRELLYDRGISLEMIE